jgi:hypothetical protein
MQTRIHRVLVMNIDSIKQARVLCKKAPHKSQIFQAPPPAFKLAAKEPNFQERAHYS